MMDEAREVWLEGHQDGRIHPLGHVLRDTYSADNHESLGSDVAGLMIDLSRVPFEPAAARLVETPMASDARPSILARLTNLIGRR